MSTLLIFAAVTAGLFVWLRRALPTYQKPDPYERLKAGFVQMQIAFSDQLTPALRRAVVAIQRMSDVLEQNGQRP